MTTLRKASDLIVEELKKDGILRRQYIADTIEAMFEDPAVARLKIRNLINATCGFVELEKTIGTRDKSIMRMFTEGGNPTMDNLLAVLSHIIQIEECTIDVKVRA